MRGLLFGIFLMAFCILAFIILIAAMKLEEKKERKRREKVQRCRNDVKSGRCPKDCSMCEWGGYEN